MPRVAARLRRFTAVALVIGLLAGGLIVSGSSTGAQDSLPDPSTTIRVMHVAEGGSPVDISVDGEVVIEGLAYGEASPYNSVVPGDHDFVIHPTDSDGTDSDITSSQTVNDGESYIVLISNGDDGLESQRYQVDLDRTDTADARVRLLNASPDVGGLDMFAEDDQWFNNIEANEASDYKEVEFGNRDLALQLDDGGDTILGPSQTLMDWGVVYDLIVFGSTANDTLDTLTLTTSVSPKCTTLMGIEGLPSYACITFSNFAPGVQVPAEW